MLEELKKDDFIVRHFKKNDYDAIINLWEKTGLGGAHRGDDLNIIENTIQQGGFFIVLEYLPSKRIIGTAWITNDHRRLYLHHFGIDPDFQGKKLSHLLAQASVEIGKKMGLQMKLEVHATNEKAKNLYLKYGFKDLGDYEVMIIRNYEK